MLAARRLTEVQLRERLAKRDFDQATIDQTVAACASAGFIDDALFARLYVETRPKALGNRRLVAELVGRGIDREIAQGAVASAERGEDERLDRAIEKVLRTRPGIALPSAARALERLGFPAPAIYRRLREVARAECPIDEVIPA
jgi:regulatory protein